MIFDDAIDYMQDIIHESVCIVIDTYMCLEMKQEGCRTIIWRNFNENPENPEKEIKL